MTLDGVTVVDLSRMISGPYATMLLSDLGADVIKVEPPEGDENRRIGPPFKAGEGAFYLAANRGKRSVVLDLMLPEGRSVLWRLIDRADVIVHNFRPETAKRFEIDYPSISKRRPDAVYCAIDAFGSDGPYANRGGTDLIIQGMSGLMSVTGEAGGLPVRAGTPVADVSTGLFSAYAILAALLRREHTGQGECIEVPMLSVAVALQAATFAYADGLGTDPPRTGSRSQISIAGDFATLDGRLNVAVPTDKFWRRLCRAVGRLDLLADPRLATNEGRMAHQEEVYTELERVFATRRTAEWEDLLAFAGIVCGPVLTYEEVCRHPQVEHLGILPTLRHPGGEALRLAANPVRFIQSALRPVTAPPELGQDTASVLREAGFDETAIARLHASGVTAPKPAQGGGAAEAGTATPDTR